MRSEWARLQLSSLPPDRAQVAKSVEATGGHAGRALAALIGPISAGRSGVSKVEAIDTLPVLPEFMIGKIADLASQMETEEKESAGIQQKFKLLYRNENDEMDFTQFRVLLTQLGVGDEMTDLEAELEWNRIDADGSGFIDNDEFENWMKKRLREDAQYVKGLRGLGNRSGYAKIKIPPVKASLLDSSKGRAGTRTQKFLKAGNGGKARLGSEGKQLWFEVSHPHLILVISPHPHLILTSSS